VEGPDSGLTQTQRSPGSPGRFRVAILGRADENATTSSRRPAIPDGTEVRDPRSKTSALAGYNVDS
jgi:hypothetical protein